MFEALTRYRPVGSAEIQPRWLMYLPMVQPRPSPRSTTMNDSRRFTWASVPLEPLRSQRLILACRRSVTVQPTLTLAFDVKYTAGCASSRAVEVLSVVNWSSAMYRMLSDQPLIVTTSLSAARAEVERRATAPRAG